MRINGIHGASRREILLFLSRAFSSCFHFIAHANQLLHLLWRLATRNPSLSFAGIFISASFLRRRLFRQGENGLAFSGPQPSTDALTRRHQAQVSLGALVLKISSSTSTVFVFQYFDKQFSSSSSFYSLTLGAAARTSVAVQLRGLPRNS